MAHLSDCKIKLARTFERREYAKGEHRRSSALPQPSQPFGPRDMLDRVIKPVNTFLSPDTVIPHAYDFGPVESGDSKIGHPANTGDVIWLTAGIWWRTCEQLTGFWLWGLRLQPCLDDVEWGHYRQQSARHSKEMQIQHLAFRVRPAGKWHMLTSNRGQERASASSDELGL